MNFKLLVVDLCNKAYEILEVPENLVMNFLGGRGLGVRLFFDFIGKDYFNNPDFSKSPVFFLTGPLTGSLAPLSGRFHSVFHSPLTGTICDSSCGGKTGVFFKSNGIDGLVIKGFSDAPIFIVIDGDRVEFRDGAKLKSKLMSERERALKNEIGEDTSTILIGPAGERGIRFANVVSEHRFFGRGGLGYLLGKKNFLGIVVKRGKVSLNRPANKEQFDFVVEEVKKWIHGNPITSQGLPEFGTSVLMNLINELKILPHKNFSERFFSKADAISGESLKQKVIKRKACYSCMVGCGRVTEKGEGPEFETLWALGANLGIDDLDFIIDVNELCYQQGMDTITLGSTISAYLEAKGLNFGDKDLVRKVIEGLVKQEEEFGILKEGSKKMCEALGRQELSMSVKGMEIPAYHPSGLYGMALAYATSNRGACHLRSYMIAPEVLGIPKLINPKIKTGKSGLVIYFQNSHAVADSAIFCRFLSLAVTDDYLSRLVSAYTGMDLSTVDYQRIGERIYVLERFFNTTLGFCKKDDILPERVRFEGFEDMLIEYYSARGYDENGVPTEEKLKGLGLADILESYKDV